MILLLFKDSISEDTLTHINTDRTTTIAAFSVAVSFPNVETRGERIPVDTANLTKDGGCNAFENTNCTCSHCLRGHHEFVDTCVIS